MTVNNGSFSPMDAEPEPQDELWELRLYVAGQTQNSLTAFANLKKICEEHLAGKYYIEVIDLLENPKLARGDQFWLCQPWCASCQNRSRRSSAIYPIQIAYWSV